MMFKVPHPSKQLLYPRVLLKMSGEALLGDQSLGIDPKVLDRMALEIKSLVDLKVQVSLVIGGGNLFRGATLSKAGLDRISGDHMGMLATIMNAIAMRDALERAGMPARVMSAIPMSGMVEHYDRRQAMHHLNEGRVVLFAGGTGNPLVSTDSAASLRAIEVGANLILKATKVDGVYTADPIKNPTAQLYKKISYETVLQKELGVMDLTAFCLCRDHNMRIIVFNINKPGALKRIILGEKEGTLVDVGVQDER